ncbi:AMP-binding protein [Aquincola tertiaricarbonis]|uniref:AMP-binding protein n=1 Tax=Aquincola tertiaricarbonis TaxID=391953 RepID=UPI000614DCCF|nr:AMP-binding protein [Aquincola tertiaricarbonis]
MHAPPLPPLPPLPRIATLADVRRVEQQPYRQFMPHATVQAGLEAAAQRHGGRVAITSIDEPDLRATPRRWTYQALLQDIRRAANLFHALGDGRPPRIALMLPPTAEGHIALWGAEAAGTACPINYQLGPGHIAELLRACGAQLLVALGPAPDLDIWPQVDRIRAACPGLRHVLAVPAGPGLPLPPGVRNLLQEMQAHRADALDSDTPATPLAALFHTGGTTGAPKLAQHSHANQLHAAWGAACMFGTNEHDVVLSGFPMFHVAGSFVYGLSTLLSGGELVLPTRLGLRNAAFMARYAEFVQQHRVTFLAAVPTVMASLLSLDLPTGLLGGVRGLLTGGSPLPNELAAAFEARHGIPVRNILGMTESAGVISIEPLAGPRTPGSCGLPLPYTQVQVQREDGTPAAPGQPGVLRVRGPNVSPGYTDAARDAGTFEADGWLVSGDIGHVDEAGRLFVTGRAKDVIIRGAHNIDPGLIESALLRHPAVLMAAAVGQPDAYAGELPVAFVSLKPGAQLDAQSLAAFAAPHIAERPAMPKRIDILPGIPVTAVGKVYKPALRVLATQRTIDEQLAAAGITPAQARAEVRDEAGGLCVCFHLHDEAAAPALHMLMKPFALRYQLLPAAAATP